MSEFYNKLPPASIDLQRQGSREIGARYVVMRSISLWHCSTGLKASRKASPIAVYSNVVLAATGMLLGLVLASAAGAPEVVSTPLAVLALGIILHPFVLPYLLATVVAGSQAAHGPSNDTAWNVVFLVSFAPYLLFLCWLAARRLWFGRRWDALHLTSLAGIYVCVCEFMVLAQVTVTGVG